MLDCAFLDIPFSVPKCILVSATHMEHAQSNPNKRIIWTKL